jgi:hypothetical protein
MSVCMVQVVCSAFLLPQKRKQTSHHPKASQVGSNTLKVAISIGVKSMEVFM